GCHIKPLPAPDLRLNQRQAVAMVPGTGEVVFAVLALAGRRVEKLIDELRSGLNNTYRELRLLHTLESSGKCTHVGDLTRHQKLQRLFRTLVLGKADQAFIDDLGTRLSCDVASQIDR